VRFVRVSREADRRLGLCLGRELGFSRAYAIVARGHLESALSGSSRVGVDVLRPVRSGAMICAAGRYRYSLSTQRDASFFVTAQAQDRVLLLVPLGERPHRVPVRRRVHLSAEPRI
jgi:hypothetical protein